MVQRATFGPVFGRHVGFMIGSKGITINMIKSKSGAWVQIRKPDAEHQEHWFEISGEQTQVDEATRLLREIRDEAMAREKGTSTHAPRQSAPIKKVPSCPNVWDSAKMPRTVLETKQVESLPGLTKQEMDICEEGFEENAAMCYHETYLSKLARITDVEQDAMDKFIDAEEYFYQQGDEVNESAQRYMNACHPDEYDEQHPSKRQPDYYTVPIAYLFQASPQGPYSGSERWITSNEFVMAIYYDGSMIPMRAPNAYMC